MSDPIFCRRCGTKLKGESQFCVACGLAIFDDPASVADPAGTLRWRLEVPLITNRFVLIDTLIGFASTVVLGAIMFSIIFGWSNGMAGVRAGLTLAGIAGLFIWVLSFLILTVIFGNRWPLEFVIDEDGVIMNNISERARAINRLSWILALLTGRPLMAGPGLIAQSREVVGIPWDEVRTVRRHPALGVIGITGGVFHTVRLYCTPSNYADVALRVEGLVKQHAPSAVIK